MDHIDSEEVEAVAKVIYTSTLMSPEEPLWDEDEGWSDDWTNYYSKHRYRDQARSVIQYLRTTKQEEKRAAFNQGWEAAGGIIIEDARVEDKWEW